MAREDLNLGIAVFLGATLAVFAFGLSNWKAEPQGTESMDGYAQALFTDWVVPFEVLSVLLLVGLIGSVALAARIRSSEDEEGAGP